MDDVLPQSESQNMITPPNHYLNGDEVNGGEGGAGNGCISNLKIPSLSSGGEENCGVSREDGEGDEKGGGLITNFINLVSPRSTKAGEVTKRKVEDDVEAGEIVGKTEKDVGVGENGGGVISNIISNFFNPGEEDKEGEKEKDCGNKRLKMDEEGGKGGLIDNIVSHLPTSIPDDAAPTTNEASILIHSLVKD